MQVDLSKDIHITSKSKLCGLLSTKKISIEKLNIIEKYEGLFHQSEKILNLANITDVKLIKNKNRFITYIRRLMTCGIHIRSKKLRMNMNTKPLIELIHNGKLVVLHNIDNVEEVFEAIKARIHVINGLPSRIKM